MGNFNFNSKDIPFNEKDNLEKNMFIVDGNAYIYRAYYAINDLKTSQNIPVNAIYGFFSIFFKLLRYLNNNFANPYICICFDAHKKVFRNDLYPEYKANRKKMPDDLVLQLPIIKDILKKMNIQSFEIDGFEADDIIATITKKLLIDDQKFNIFILTYDKDIMQLINKSVKIFPFPKNIIDEHEFKAKFGFMPDKMLDFLSLTGDAVDNIPGVFGIGKETAKYILNEYGSVDYILENLDKLEEKYKSKILNSLDNLKISKKLLKLKDDIDFNLDVNLFNYDNIFLKDNYFEDVIDVFKNIESFSLVKKLEDVWLDVKGYIPKKNKNLDLNSNVDNLDLFSINSENSELKKYEIKEEIDYIKEQYLIDFIENIKFENIVILFTKENKSIFLYDMQDKSKIYKLNREDIYFYKNKILKIFENFNKNTIIYTDNAKCLYKFFNELNFSNDTFNFIFFDFVLAGYILDSSIQNFDLLVSKVSIKNSNILLKNQYDFFKIYSILKKELEDNKLLDNYNNIEIRFCEVLADIEKTGILLDLDYLINFRKKINSDLGKLVSNIFEKTKMSFNINSPKQLSNILFNVLNLKMSKNIEKRNKKLSTSEEILIDLVENNPESDIPKYILEYRETMKLLSTYINPLFDCVALDSRVKTTFNYTLTATGRLSSINPNLQNLPLHSENGNNFRRAFISKEGYSFVSFDYSQIDLVMMAHFSKDFKMTEAFLKKEDIHTFTAEKIFQKSKENINKKERDIAKRINFGIIYGISTFGLSRDLKISAKEAKLFINNYFLFFEGVKNYTEKVIYDAKEFGYVKTLLGRKRFVPEINEKKINVRNFGERIAVNTIIQGSSSDILKMAMVNIYDFYRNNEEVKMILQIHDEILFEIKDEILDESIIIIKEKMENVYKLKVPLSVNLKKGKNLKDLDIYLI